MLHAGMKPVFILLFWEILRKLFCFEPEGRTENVQEAKRVSQAYEALIPAKCKIKEIPTSVLKGKLKGKNIKPQEDFVSFLGNGEQSQILQTSLYLLRQTGLIINNLSFNSIEPGQRSSPSHSERAEHTLSSPQLDVLTPELGINPTMLLLHTLRRRSWDERPSLPRTAWPLTPSASQLTALRRTVNLMGGAVQGVRACREENNTNISNKMLRITD